MKPLLQFWLCFSILELQEKFQIMCMNITEVLCIENQVKYHVQGVHSLIQQQNKLLGDIRERLGTQEEYEKEDSNKELNKEESDKVERMESTRADELRQLRQFSEQLSRVVV